MSDYVPTTEEVRECAESDNPYGSLEEGAFDRWLAKRDREVSEKAFREGAEAFADSFWDGEAGIVTNPYMEES